MFFLNKTGLDNFFVSAKQAVANCRINHNYQMKMVDCENEHC